MMSASETPLASHLSTCDIQYPGAYLAVRSMTLPKDENFMGDIFGGYILSEMDIAGACCVDQILNDRITTSARSAL